MPKNPYLQLYDRIYGFELFLVLWAQNLSYHILLKEGTTSKFPASDIIALRCKFNKFDTAVLGIRLCQEEQNHETLNNYRLTSIVKYRKSTKSFQKYVE